MKLPFVSRERYDEKCAELATLQIAHAKLLEKGYEALAARREPRTPKPQRDPLLDKLTADIAGTITDPAAARAEAERIKREAFGGAL